MKERNYELVISQLLEGYRRQDPWPEPKLVVPVFLPNTMYIRKIGRNEGHKSAGDFGLIVFYHLLCVGEYSYNRKIKKKTNATILTP